MEEDCRRRFDFLFEKFPICARRHKVVGIPHEVDFIPRFRRSLEGRFQTVQHEVGQQGRDQASLRSACGGRKQLALFPVAGFEPFAQQLLIHRDVLQQPLVADFIETGPDVSFEYPSGGYLAGEHGVALGQGIGTTAAFAKTIGVSVGQNLGDGCECQRIKGLHGAVVQGGDAQGTPAQGPGSVSVTFEVEGSVEFLFSSSPDYVVYTGGFGPPICRYSLHGQ